MKLWSQIKQIWSSFSKDSLKCCMDLLNSTNLTDSTISVISWASCLLWRLYLKLYPHPEHPLVAGLQGIHRRGGRDLAAHLRLPQADLSGDATGGSRSSSRSLWAPLSTTSPSTAAPRTASGPAPATTITPNVLRRRPLARHLTVLVHIVVLWHHHVHHHRPAPGCVPQIRGHHLQFVQL